MDASTNESATAEMLPWEEIKRRYPNEWVVLAPYQDDDDDDDTMTGVVFAHSPERRGVTGVCKLPEAAILWTGEIKGIRPAMLAYVAPKV